MTSNRDSAGAVSGGPGGKGLISKELVRREHSDYSAFKDEWQFLWESYEGGEAYVQSENLFQHVREKDILYQGRKARSFYYNYCQAVIDTYLAHLNRQAPIVAVRTPTGSPAWEDFAARVNPAGESLSEFRRNMQLAAMILGHVHILVDKPRQTTGLPGGRPARSRLEEIELGLIPYFQLILPFDIIDWQLDVYGKLIFVKIREPASAAGAPAGAPVVHDLASLQTSLRAASERSRAGSPDGSGEASLQTSLQTSVYRYWFRDRWVLVSEDGGVLDEGEHNLGEVPIITCYNRKRLRRRFIGQSALNDIARVNRRILNLCSLIDEFAYLQCFAMLAQPKEHGAAVDEEEVGVNIIWEFPETTTHTPFYLSPPTEPALYLQSEVERSIQEIYRLARLESGFQAGLRLGRGQPASGVAKAFDFLQTSTVLSEKASNFEEAERSMVRLWLKWQNAANAEFTVEYPDEFEIRTLEKDLKDALNLKQLLISPAFEQMMNERIVRKTLPQLSESDMIMIQSEISCITTRRFKQDGLPETGEKARPENG